MTKTWLSATLDADQWQHDILLAELLPVLLETLPDGVDRWFFERGRDRLDPRFRGNPVTLWGHLRGWAADAGLTGRMSVDECVVPDAELAVSVFHADSNTVLTQLRLAHARALSVEPHGWPRWGCPRSLAPGSSAPRSAVMRTWRGNWRSWLPGGDCEPPRLRSSGPSCVGSTPVPLLLPWCGCGSRTGRG